MNDCLVIFSVTFSLHVEQQFPTTKYLDIALCLWYEIPLVGDFREANLFGVQNSYVLLIESNFEWTSIKFSG